MAYRGIGPGDESVATFALPSAISAGDAVALSVENVTLPPVPGRQVISIDTTADIAPVSVAVLTRSPAAVTLGSSSESSDAPGATAVTYTETFVASANGALAAGNGSITLVAPPGTRFSANGTITDLTTHASAPGGVGYAGDNGAVISLVTRIPIRPGDRVELVMVQVTNPSAQVGQLAVSTSSDEALGSRPAPAAHTNRWVSTIASSLRTPRESLTPLKSVPANVGLAGADRAVPVLPVDTVQSDLLGQLRRDRRVVGSSHPPPPAVPVRAIDEGAPRPTRPRRRGEAPTCGREAGLRRRVRRRGIPGELERPDVPARPGFARDAACGRALDGRLPCRAGPDSPRLPRSPLPRRGVETRALCPPASPSRRAASCSAG